MSQTSAAQDPHEKEHNVVDQLLASKAYVENPEIIPWYTKDLEELKPGTRELFENYSKVASADVVPHIKQVRDRAFQIFPYPCLGNWGFLNLTIGEGPAYGEVLGRVKGGEKLLDLGCCMGQDVRKLAHDGAPSENTYASDLKKTFWDLGYDMFLDKSTLKTRFLEADIFDTNSELNELDGQIDIVNAASFFHLFDWDDQVKVAKRVIRLLRPNSANLIIGRQGGRPEPGNLSHVKKDMTAYWHNPESWAKLWEKVGNESGTEWKVEASFGEEDLSKRMKTNLVPPGTRFMTFVIRRV